MSFKLSEIPKDKDWIDYSSLSMFQTCPSQYYWRVVLGLTEDKPSASLLNGTAYHEALAAYYNCKRDLTIGGMPQELAHIEAIKAAMLNLKGFTDSDGKKVGGVINQIVDDPARNLTVAGYTLIDYFERWKDEPYSTIDTEIGFAVDLEMVTGMSGFPLFVGKIDRRALAPYGKVIFEQKTTTIVGERWQSRGKPNLQIDGYVAADFIQTGEMPQEAKLDVIPIHKDNAKRKEAFRIPTNRSEKDVDLWIEEVGSWWELITRCKDTGIWSHCTERCLPLLGFSCDYPTLCKMYPDLKKPSVIEIPGGFKVEHWAPWELTGDKE